MKILRLKNKKALSEYFVNTNLILLTIIGLLCLIGLVALYSSSLHVEKSFFHKVVGKQIIRMLLGMIFATVVFFIQKKLVFNSAYVLYWICIFLVIFPLLFGSSVAGTSRWINLGLFNFQPSEMMKIFLVIAIAKYVSSTELSMSEFKVFLVPLFLTLLPLVIVLKQPDLGTSMIFIAIFFPMLYWADVRLFHIFILFAPIISIITAFNFYTFFIWIIIMFVVFYLSKEKLWISIILSVVNLSLGFVTPFLWDKLKPYQQNRILTLFNMEADPLGAGYQVIQSQVAIGSGGMYGKGLGNGTQTHLKFLPEQHNDFIFSVIGEEYGFIGVVIVLVLFLFMILLCIQAAYRVKDKFSSLVIIGITSIILFHVIINVAMTIGLMPVTGLPLPFLSYGGSFIITCFIMVGIVLNFSIERYMY